ncbi:hypothetical protein ACKS0A_04596 [Histoplasma ohiense]
MREHVQPRIGHEGHHIEIPRVITRQALDEDIRRLLLDLHNCLCTVPRAAICEIIPIDRSQHHVSQAPPRERLSSIVWLVRVERRRLVGCFHAAEATAARAGVAHKHYCSCRRRLGAAAPAIGDVGAAGFLADGVQV